MDLQELIKKADQLKDKYNKEHKEKGEPEWGVTEYTQGFVGDVGKLMKLIMAKQDFYNYENLDNKIKHELADCLYSVFVIASELNINLEKSFIETMDELKNKS
jgi:NTP pyrophosphatase (non-canonical NTP hydrolase)